jgi:hypothetical protein
MVQALGGVGAVQKAIDRFNRTGVARFASGGVVAGGQQSSSSAQNGADASQPVVQVKVVNVPGNKSVEDYLRSREGEKLFLNYMDRTKQVSRTL